MSKRSERKSSCIDAAETKQNNRKRKHPNPSGKNGKAVVTIEFYHKLAKNRGGQCLSTFYKNCNTPLRFICAMGHAWTTTGFSVRNKCTWCPDCRKSVMEQICREIFEHIFGVPFPTMRPSWLINPLTGQRLEIDGLSEPLALGFEYNGVITHDTDPAQMARDAVKVRVCEERKVTLVVIPGRLSIVELQPFIMAALKDVGVAVRKNIHVLAPHEFQLKPRNTEYLKEVREIARDREGRCLDDKYLTSGTRMRLVCKHNHQFSLSRDDLRRGRWCMQCFLASIRHTLANMHALAAQFGGKYLSASFTNMDTKENWECARGHQFPKRPAAVRQGHFCKDCSNIDKSLNAPNKKMLEHVKIRAASKTPPVSCLSNEYRNSKQLLLFLCSVAGHGEFSQSYNGLRRSSCPKCGNGRKGKNQSKERKKTTEKDIQAAAKLMGLTCRRIGNPKKEKLTNKSEYSCKCGVCKFEWPTKVLYIKTNLKNALKKAEELFLSQNASEERKALDAEPKETAILAAVDCETDKQSSSDCKMESGIHPCEKTNAQPEQDDNGHDGTFDSCDDSDVQSTADAKTDTTAESDDDVEAETQGDDESDTQTESDEETKSDDEPEAHEDAPAPQPVQIHIDIEKLKPFIRAGTGCQPCSDKLKGKGNKDPVPAAAPTPISKQPQPTVARKDRATKKQRTL